MTFVPRSRFAGLSAHAPLALAFVLVAMVAGCEDKHIGRVCDLNAGGGMGGMGGSTTGGTTATINAQALECPSRICLQPVIETGTNTTSLCTADCSSDDDCSDGESRGSGTGDLRCQKGFKCIVPVTVGDFCCRRMCVCKDFLADPNAPFTNPSECDAPSACKNVK